MKRQQIEELLYQALETEAGGIEVYQNAVACAENDDLKEEWEKYGKQTTRHKQIMVDVCRAFGLDPNKETPGRRVVRGKAKALIASMKEARSAGDPKAAQLVAAEAVVDAETKDHMNWELMGELVDKLSGAERKTLKEAYDEVEDEEDEHLYHTKGWLRELWLESLGLPAVLPPPEEKKDVKTAIGAARAEQQRSRMLKKKSG